MRIAAVYSISPVRLEQKGKKVESYQREELERLFSQLLSKGFLSSAYTLYSQALRELKNGNLIAFRNVLRRMRELLNGERKGKTEFKSSDEGGAITLVDRSDDVNVSFKAPASVPAFASYLFISAHEGEHARRILRKALLEGKRVQVLVRVFYRYDSRGRLIAVGGLTTADVIDTVRDEIFEAVA